MTPVSQTRGCQGDISFVPDAIYSGYADLTRTTPGPVSAAACEPPFPPCYVRGVMVATPGGDVAVEALSVGDMVLTASNQARAVSFIARYGYSGRFLARSRSLHPVRLTAGCLGKGLPRRDLRLSQGSAVFVDGFLVPADCLINDATIAVERGIERVDYIRLDFDSHELLLAHGVPVESSIDIAAGEGRGPQRAVPRPDRSGFVPWLEDGFGLEAIRSRLLVVNASAAAP